MSAIDRLLNRAAPTDSFTFAYSPDDIPELERLEQAAETARSEAESHPQSATARKARQKAESAAKAFREALVTVTLDLRSIGSSAFEQLQNEHPPTDDQTEQARTSALGAGIDPDLATPQFNADTFPPAMLAATVTKITFSDTDETADGFTVDEATSFWQQEAMTQGDRIGLIIAARTLHERPSRVEALGKG